MSAQPRLELKYRLDAFRYQRLRAAVAGHLRLDRYSRRAGGRYLVRSLYYDSAGLDAYVDKLAGVATRVKPRLRAYGHRLEDTPFVSVELKGRIGMAIVKEAAQVDHDTYRRFVDRQDFGAEDRDDASRSVLEGFERALRRGTMRPVVLVAYRREAYTARIGHVESLRVTFDHDVRTAASANLFDTVRWRRSPPGAVVLEVKTPRRVPPWLEQVVIEHGLVSEPNSKYTQAVEQSFPAIALR